MTTQIDALFAYATAVYNNKSDETLYNWMEEYKRACDGTFDATNARFESGEESDEYAYDMLLMGYAVEGETDEDDEEVEASIGSYGILHSLYVVGNKRMTAAELEQTGRAAMQAAIAENDDEKRKAFIVRALEQRVAWTATRWEN